MIALLAALVVIVGVVCFIVVQNVNAQAEQARYEACLASHGYTRENGKTDKDLEGLIAADACG